MKSISTQKRGYNSLKNTSSKV